MSNFTINAQNDDLRNEVLDALHDEANENGAHRSANVGIAAHDDLGNSTHTPAKQTEAVSMKGGNTLWTPQHAAFLDQHIFLNKDTRASDTFSFINEQLLELGGGYQNFRVYTEEFKTIGYHLDETREGCYRIQLFTFNDKLGVNCTRLDGDSLALSSLWSKLKASLHENMFYVDKFLAEEDEEDIFGDEDDNEDMDSFKYLDFSRDEAFVGKLVDDVLDLNVGTHALMLLKFNFQKEKNLQLVAGTKFSQKLFNNTVERLNIQQSSLPATICAAHILKNLVENAELSVTAEQVSTIAYAAERLCAENEESRTIVPTASEEASVFLLETIPQATEKVSEHLSELDIQDQLKCIITKTSFDNVRDTAEALIESN